VIGKETGEKMSMGLIPLPFPNGKGAGYVMGLAIVQLEKTKYPSGASGRLQGKYPYYMGGKKKTMTASIYQQT
jgi:hypothetical protein